MPVDGRGFAMRTAGAYERRGSASNPNCACPGALLPAKRRVIQTFMDLRTISGTQIAALIREGRIRSRDAVEAHIEQIERVNPSINAVVASRFDEARREADEADRVRANTPADRLPPFHGVPCTVKECFALCGMPNASGLLRRKHVVATADATVVRRVRAAGAIPLGVTNTSELCMWMESNNYVYGRSSNPYDTTRIVGGSSGGEAAIIAAGGSPFGIGSDIGGSIRGPAFFNGVFGHKPTGGLVPGTGQHPIAGPRAMKILTTGPLARRAEDLWPLLTIMAGPDDEDPGCEIMTLGNPDAVRIDGMTVIDVPDNGATPIAPYLREAQQRVAEALARKGAKVRVMRFDALARSFDIWSAILGEAQDVPFREMLGEGTPISPMFELLKWSVGKSQHTFMASLLALGDGIPKLLPGRTRKLVEMGTELRRQLVEAIGPHGVMLYPTYATSAPRHNHAVWTSLSMTFPFAYQGIMNVMQLPSTQVPLGLGPEGLPIGCQVIGVHGNDHVTIAVARELERAFGGWIPPKRWMEETAKGARSERQVDASA